MTEVHRRTVLPRMVGKYVCDHVWERVVVVNVMEEDGYVLSGLPERWACGTC